MDRKQTLKEIQELTKSLHDNLIGFGIDYHNKVLGGDISKKREFDLCMRLRDSILYKIKCVNFHLDLLLQLDKILSDKLRSILFNRAKEFDLMIQGGDEQLFCLDDITFHIISLFDFIGNLAGYLFYGEQRIKLKWKGVVTCCKNPNWEKSKTGKEQIKNSDASSLIIKNQHNLISRLEEYRANLFHYLRDDAKRRVTTRLSGPIESKFTVGIPVGFQKWIKPFIKQSKDGELELIDISLWLVRKSFMAAKEIIIALHQDLHKKCNADREVHRAYIRRLAEKRRKRKETQEK